MADLGYLRAIARATPVLPARAHRGASVALPSSLSELFAQAAAELAERYGITVPPVDPDAAV